MEKNQEKKTSLPRRKPSKTKSKEHKISNKEKQNKDKTVSIHCTVLNSALYNLYKIVDCISIGSPSSVYVIQTVQDGRLYALKMTECLDESEAIKAYEEEMELKKMENAYVCGYKEFFITYDKKDSSMYVNIVMQYFPEGNLKTFIRRFQNKSEVMPEQTVKKILGEILQGLVYIHECGLLHRNIKPSNVFLKEGGFVVLGDLGVSTVMGDLQTHTRQTFSGMVFMAPEIGQRPHDEKSDLYSVGGVLLNMLTTSLLSEQEFYQKLGEIRTSPEILDNILELISDKYTKSMVISVQTLLRHRHGVRPRMLEFIKAGFIQECMAPVDSSQMNMQTIQMETKSSKKQFLAENRDNVYKVLEFIADTIDHEASVADGLSALADIVRDNDKAHELIDQKARNLISLAMWDSIYNKDIQVAGCYILSNLVVFSKPNDILFTHDVITIIHKIMAGHEYDSEVQLAAANFILALSANEKATHYVVQLGGIQDMLTAMRHARYHATLNAVCCMALWSLTVDNENLKIACRENACKDICLALSTHKVSPDVCESASAALVSLLLDDSCYDVFNELECAGNLVSAIHLHKKNAKVVKNCCKVLAIVVEASEESAYKFLSTNKEDGGSPAGIPTVMEAYKVHKDNSDVVESIVRLFLELSNYDNISSEMQEAMVGPLILSEVSKRHKHNMEIMGPVKEALDRLGNNLIGRRLS